MRDSTFYDQLSTCFPWKRSKVAIETPAGRKWSYADLDNESGRIANFLAELGVEHGDRVVACLGSTPETLCLYLACLRSGAIYVPLPRAARGPEAEHVLDDAEPKLVVCGPRMEKTLFSTWKSQRRAPLLTLDGAGGGTLWERSRCCDRNFLTPQDASAEDVAAILYTSGTTGRPKGAMLTHHNLAHNASALADSWGFGEDDRLIHVLPLHHVHGLFVACHCALLAGATMVMLPKFDADQVVELLPTCTVLMGVPTTYVRLLANRGLNPEVCRNMRLFTSGSAPLRDDTFREFERRTRHLILERYGMTETLITFSNPLRGERRPGCVGIPLPGIEARIVNDVGESVAPGTVGQLEVRGANLFSGYWRQPEQTARAFRQDGYFVTGDLARLEHEGATAIVGRVRDLVITGGENVYPKEVERALDGLPGVYESAVLGVPHADWGEAVIAVVVPEDENQPPTMGELLPLLDTLLARYKVPKGIFLTDELPRNAMGKVQKNLLRQRFRHTFEPPEG